MADSRCSRIFHFVQSNVDSTTSTRSCGFIEGVRLMADMMQKWAGARVRALKLASA